MEATAAKEEAPGGTQERQDLPSSEQCEMKSGGKILGKAFLCFT